jgi:NAD(P)-dependent dehydrogenase (short-subunit alcohol dehydrogenase family)
LARSWPITTGVIKEMTSLQNSEKFSELRCAGRVALVTGAAGSGMGRSIALTLAREGADVLINYRSRKSSANAIVESITSNGGQAIAVQADIFTAVGCQRLVDTAQSHFGKIDICIVGPGGGWHPEPIDKLVAEDALEDLHNEVAPIHYLMPLVLPEMYERNWGRIIGISQHPRTISPAYAYNVGKGARTQALLLASEQAWSQGVTINVIAPGPVSGIDALNDALEQCKHGEKWHSRENISPQDIAEGIIFLCSEAGRYVTGCVLPYTFNG